MTLDRLYRDVEKLKHQYRGLAGGPQLSLSSIENGSIDSKDAAGNLKMTIGEQDDGGNTINVLSGPTPPTPTGFTVDVDHGKFIVHWQGVFTTGRVAPSDWSRAEVHASQDPFFVPDRTTARGSIVSAAGGELTIGVLKGPWTVKMVSWSQAGKMSLPSQPVDVDVPGYGEIVLEEIDAAQTLIKNAGEILVTEQGTLDEKLTEVDGTLNDLGQDLQAVEDAQAQLGTDLSDVMLSVDGKNTIKWDPAAPTSATPGKATGDLWYRTSGNSIIGFWKWSGSAWVAQLLDVTTIPLINIGSGTFGALDGARLKVGSVYSDSIVSGLSQNMVPDPGFSSATISNTRVASASSYGAVISISNGELLFDTSAGITASPNVPLAATSDLYAWSAYPNMPVVFRVSARVDGSAQLRMNIRYKTRSGSTMYVVMPPSVHTLTSSWAEYASTYALPQDAVGYSVVVQVQSNATGVVRVRAPFAASTVGTTVIEGGAVTTDKLSANVLEVGNLKAGTAAINEAVVNKLWAEAVVAKMVTATEFIGENAILTGAVTASKITASEELWAKLGQFVNVRAEMIDSDAFTGRVFTANTYMTSNGSEWSDRGLFIVGPDGEVLINAPTDGSPLNINADSTTIRSASIDELEAGDTSLTAESTLTLEAGQQKYPRAPEVRAGWYPSATFMQPDVEYSYEWLGLAAWGDKWVRGVNVLGAEGDTLDAVEVYDADGIHEKTITIDVNPQNGVAVIGDVVYALGRDHLPTNTKNWVHGFDLNTGARVTRWEFPYDTPHQFGIGAAGGDLIIAGVQGNKRIYVYTFSTGGGLKHYPSTPWDVAYTKDLIGVALDGTTLRVGHQKNIRTYTYTPTSLVRKDPDDLGWENPNKNGAGFDMTRGWPFVVTGSGELFEGSVFVGNGHTIETAVTFVDGEGHETDTSEIALIGVDARQSAAISVPSRAAANTRVYYRLDGGVWQSWDAGEEAKRFWVDYIPATREADPPTVNTFPNSSPSVVQAAAGPFTVRGDGSGRWGPLTFNADGTMTSAAIPAWVPVTTFKSGFTAGDFGFTPAYRVWPDQKVEWRGVLKGAVPDLNTSIITIPAAAKPTQLVELPATCNGGAGGGVTRLEFTGTNYPNDLRVIPQNGNITWISLDGCYYYKS